MDERKMIQNIIKRSEHLIPSRRVDFNTLQKQINLSQEGVEIAAVIYMDHVIEFNKNYYEVRHPELKKFHWIIESGWNTEGDSRLIFTKVYHVMDKERYMSDETDVSEHYEFTYNVILSQKIAQAITAIIMFPDLKRALG